MVAQNTATLPASFGKSGFGSSPTGPSGSGVIATDTVTELTASNGVTIDKPVSLSSTLAVTGNSTLTGTLAVTGATTLTGAVAASGGITLPGTNPTVFHSGGVAPVATTTGNDTTPVNTETYVVEVVVPFNVTLTGISLLNGSAAAGNVTVGLTDSTGAPIAAAKSASTAQSGTAAYQQIPFAVAYVAKAGKYFVQVQFDTNTTPRFRTHILGNFGASKQTAQTYGAFTAVTPPTTFTANQGPICDTY